MLERGVDKRFTKGLKKMSLTSIKLTAFGAMGEAGWPDRLVLCPAGQAIFVELKKPGGKATPLQKARQRVLAGLGFGVGTFDNADEALEFVRVLVEFHHVLGAVGRRQRGPACRL